MGTVNIETGSHMSCGNLTRPFVEDAERCGAVIHSHPDEPPRYRVRFNGGPVEELLTEDELRARLGEELSR